MTIKTKLAAAFAAGATLAAGGGLAYASIPDGNGVIHGCYAKGSNLSVRPGSLRVVDTGSGQGCAQTEIPLTWSQTGPQGAPGPQGPVGPSDAYMDSNGSFVIPTKTTVVLDKLTLPAGAYVLSGSANLFDLNLADLQCWIRVNGNNQFEALGRVELGQTIPFSGAVALPNGGTVDTTCWTNDPNVFADSVHLIAVKVGALH
jgi:hypothetical protein